MSVSETSTRTLRQCAQIKSGCLSDAMAERVRLPNLKPSTTSISLRLPVTLLERIKVAANKRDVPYQSPIKTRLAERTETR
jgi:predicted DNA binding CopG/RHH family protein